MEERHKSKELKKEKNLKKCENDRGKSFLGSYGQQNKEIVYKKQTLKRKQKEKNKALIKGGNEIEVIYTCMPTYNLFQKR